MPDRARAIFGSGLANVCERRLRRVQRGVEMPSKMRSARPKMR
jgi:hypothetical protein